MSTDNLQDDNSACAADEAYKRLAKQLHPDHGGNTEAMQDLNALHDEAEKATKYQFTKGHQRNHQADVKVDAADPFQEPPAAETGEDLDEALTIDGIVFPREASAHIRAMSVEERAEWDTDRARAMTDPIYLSGILGMDLQEDPHQVLFRQLLTMRGRSFPLSQLDTFHKKMVLWPRGCAKTTSSRVLMAQIILNYPSVRLCFLTGGDVLAKRQLAALKACFEKPTQRFQELFPEFCLKSIFNKKTHKWQDINPVMGTTQQFSIPCRPTTVYAEPTFAISTPKSVKSGAHMDFLFSDDIVNDQNYSNAAALEKCYQQYLDTLPLLDPSGFLILTGTVYSYADVYARIQENVASTGDLSNWRISVRDCWSQGKCSCGHADVFHDRSVNVVEPPCTAEGCACKGFVGDGVKGVLFPQVKLADGRLFGYTIEWLNQQRAELGDAKFANQYENKITATSQQQFTETMIGAQTVFTPEQLPPWHMPTYIMCDLAYSVEANRDETVFLVFKKYLGALWVVDCVAGHFGSNQLIEETLKLTMKWRPTSLFIEKNPHSWEHIQNLLIAKAPDFGVANLPIQWISQSNVKDAKLLRISGIQTYLMGKRLWLYANIPHYNRLVQQLLRFPRSGHDDLADCLGLATEAPTFFTSDPTPTQIQQTQSPSSWLRRLNPVQTEDEIETRIPGSY
jgi:phage terminase large subunit-like protein